MTKETAQPAQEPVAWLTRDSVDGCWYATAKKVGKDDKPLYTTPPQREPLTDEQIEDIAAKTMFPINFARAIEAAHGIKENT